MSSPTTRFITSTTSWSKNPQGNTGNAQPKPTEPGMLTTLEACKIAFNNSVDQFNQLQEKNLFFSHYLKQPFDQATGS